jgi:hypothetical protein
MNARIEIIRDRNERATRESTTIIEAERKARVEKTKRLRALRLAQGPQEMQTRGKAHGTPQA